MLEKSATLNELSGLLADSDLFRNFAYAEIRATARYFNLIEIAKDHVIFREGDPGALMFIVSSGNISILKANQEMKKS
ncbi:MAG: hypothetical protein WDM70_11325 [Nitrosomonadales bacterium]